ncbi:MAG: hypothetical protein O7A69_10070 [SAR324 cluster bacterium]|nr:hypothetical protein [SAR324 cluster bacterium]
MASKSGKGKKSTQRKLTAILCADVTGYSRLMGADEERTQIAPPLEIQRFNELGVNHETRCDDGYSRFGPADSF